MGHHHVVFTKPRNSGERNALTLLEMQPLPDFEKIVSRDDFFCLKLTKKQRYEKKLFKLPDRCKQVEHCQRLLPPQHILEMGLKTTDY